MKRVHLKTEIRREQIASAALDIVVSKGVRAMTVEAVARRVNLAPSALYRHYAGKLDLLHAVVELLQRRIYIEIENVVSDDVEPLDNLYNILVMFAGMVGENQAMPQILFSDEVFMGGPEKRLLALKIPQVLIESAQNFLRQAAHKGQIRVDTDVESLSRIFMGLFIPGALFYHATSGQFDTVSQVQDAWRIFRKGIEL